MVDIVTAAIGAKMASAQVQNMVDTALSSVYKYKGQCTNAQLASKTKTAGDVWEISDDGTYAAGTDVVCDGSSWSAMAGHLHVQVVDTLDSTSATSALSANMGKALADGKQDALTAGSNIDITNNVISATDTTYTAGTGISISAENVISSSTSNSEWKNCETTNEVLSIFDVNTGFKEDVIIGGVFAVGNVNCQLSKLFVKGEKRYGSGSVLISGGIFTVDSYNVIVGLTFYIDTSSIVVMANSYDLVNTSKQTTNLTFSSGLNISNSFYVLRHK